MTNDEVKALALDRYARLMRSQKNLKSKGVLRKVARQLRQLGCIV